MPISIKNEKAIKRIAIAGNIIYDIFDILTKTNMENMTTHELDSQIHNYITDRGAQPTFLNYRGFPNSCCISLNNEVVHGIPDHQRVIKQGDLVKIDIGVTYDDYIADAAKTFAVGKVSDKVGSLLRVTKQALQKGIAMAQKGNTISNISHAIQSTVEAHGFNVVRELTGHGVGENLHEEPMIPNFVNKSSDPVIEPGMVFAIEPMVAMGTYEVLTAQNGWTICTKDGSLSSHFEDTIAILEKGNINLTRVVES